MTLPPLPALVREIENCITARHLDAALALCSNLRAAIAAVPAHPVIRTLSPEQIERHTFKASECPPDSFVMLVSSINRLLSKRPGEGIRLSQPVAWLCSLMMEDGTTRTQIVEQDPAGLRWNDDGEPSPYKVQPLYAAPQAVPVPDGWALVPVEPTQEMRRAMLPDSILPAYVGAAEKALATFATHYRAMLAAAPKEQPHE